MSPPKTDGSAAAPVMPAADASGSSGRSDASLVQDGWWNNFSGVFDEYRKRLEAKGVKLPPEQLDSWALDLAKQHMQREAEERKARLDRAANLRRITKVLDPVDELDLNLRLNNTQIEQVRKAVGAPLVADNEGTPSPQDLSTFWRRVERGLEGLNDNVDLTTLSGTGIKNFGHLILGEAAWELVEHEHFRGWADFKSVVNQRFGVGSDHLHAQFFGMVPKRNEAGEEFVLRVEERRLRMGVGDRECLAVFMPRLTGAFRERIRNLKLTLS